MHELDCGQKPPKRQRKNVVEDIWYLLPFVGCLVISAAVGIVGWDLGDTTYQVLHDVVRDLSDQCGPRGR